MSHNNSTAEAFALKHIGKRCRITNLFDCPPMVETANSYCQIIGYRKLLSIPYVIVDFEDGAHHREWSISIPASEIVITDPHNSGYGWDVRVSSIEIIDVPYKLYPHRCKLCGSPARKSAAYVLCSNMKCKSKKAVRAAIKLMPQAKFQPGDTKEDPIQIFCRCGLQAAFSGNMAFCNLHGAFSYDFILDKWYGYGSSFSLGGKSLTLAYKYEPHLDQQQLYTVYWRD